MEPQGNDEAALHPVPKPEQDASEKDTTDQESRIGIGVPVALPVAVQANAIRVAGRLKRVVFIVLGWGDSYQASVSC